MTWPLDGRPDDCTCRYLPARDTDGSEFGACDACEAEYQGERIEALATPGATMTSGSEAVGGLEELALLERVFDGITLDLLEGQRGNEDTYAWVHRVASAAVAALTQEQSS